MTDAPSDAEPDASVALVYSVAVDGDGVVTTFARSNVVQLGAVEVSAEIYAAIVDRHGLARFDGTAVVAYTPPAPPPAIPTVVSNYQARTVLIERGYLAKVDAALRGADQTVVANQIALAAWDYANTFERGSPIIAAMAQLLGLAPADVDELFIAASQVT